MTTVPRLQCYTPAPRVRTTSTTMSPSLCVCLLIFHLLVGGALGKTKAIGGDEGRNMEKEEERKRVAMEEFMEEIRRAMSSQWEILQNIRYHTLVTKVRVAQLETQVKKLTSQVEDTSQAPQLVHTGKVNQPEGTYMGYTGITTHRKVSTMVVLCPHRIVYRN